MEPDRIGKESKRAFSTSFLSLTSLSYTFCCLCEEFELSLRPYLERTEFDLDLLELDVYLLWEEEFA